MNGGALVPEIPVGFKAFTKLIDIIKLKKGAKATP
jgi:hypothetical protein